MTQNDNAEDILAIAATWKAAGEDVAIATVVETWGSSPRPAGSRLAITKSGKAVALKGRLRMLRGNPWRQARRNCSISEFPMNGPGKLGFPAVAR
jgi:hypothetical protein